MKWILPACGDYHIKHTYARIFTQSQLGGSSVTLSCISFAIQAALPKTGVNITIYMNLGNLGTMSKNNFISIASWRVDVHNSLFGVQVFYICLI